MSYQGTQSSINSSNSSIRISPLLPLLSSLCNLDLWFIISKTPLNSLGKNSIHGAHLPAFSLFQHEQLNNAREKSLVAQLVKNPPAAQETWIRSLGWEGPLDKGKATHSGILGWKIPWAGEPGKLQSMGSQRVRHDWVTNTHTENSDKEKTDFTLSSWSYLKWLSVLFNNPATILWLAFSYIPQW